MKDLFAREPVRIIAAVHAVLSLAMGFGLHLSVEQLGLIEVALTAVLAVVTRAQVSPAGGTPLPPPPPTTMSEED